MTILSDFELPTCAAALHIPGEATYELFLAFIASSDPTTGRPWCPDVRAALPPLKAAFAPRSSPKVAFVEVGQKPR